MSVPILVTSALYRTALQALEAHYEVHRLDSAEDPDALIARTGGAIRAIAGGHAPASLIESLPNLEIVAGFGVGYDGIDIETARARGVRVTNTPDVLNDAVAELAIGMMIGLARAIVPAERFVRKGEWAQSRFTLASELNDAKLGILGLGRIGKEIAARAKAMKMEIAYHGRNRQEDQPYRYYDDLEAMARDVDWLVVIAPGGPDTKAIVSRSVLEALGPKGRIVNLARGTLVDESAMLDLLENGGLGGAALDVFVNEPDVDPRFLVLDNVLLSPHQGSATDRTRHLMGQLMVDNLKAHFAGRPLLTPVV